MVMLCSLHRLGLEQPHFQVTMAISQADYELLAAFRAALRQFLSFSERAARAAGLTPQQHQALLALKGLARGECVTVGELAQRLGIKHHSAVGLLDRLAQRRYVQRTRDSADRRRVSLRLTARGESVLEQLTAAHREQLRRLGPEIHRLLRRLAR